MAVDVRYLPGQDPGEILAQVRQIPGIDVERTFIHPPVTVSRRNPFVRGLREAVARAISGEVVSVGRDGASDAASFIEAGIPAVDSGRRAPATMAPTSGSRSLARPATGTRWPTSSARCPRGWPRPTFPRPAARSIEREAWLADPAHPRWGMAWRFLRLRSW